jgi:kinesin family protein 22
MPKPHFAAVAIQPPAPKPAPAILQSISTEGIGSGAATVGASGLTRSRYSLVPVPKLSRVSGAYGYQPFALPGGGRRAAVEKDRDKEKIREPDGDRSGSVGVGLTEKEIDERVGSVFPLSRRS